MHKLNLAIIRSFVFSTSAFICLCSAFADVAPEPGEPRREGATASLKRRMIEVCNDKKEGSACSINSSMNGTCVFYAVTGAKTVLHCDLSQAQVTATPN